MGRIEGAAFGLDGWVYCTDTDLSIGALNVNLVTWKHFFSRSLINSGRICFTEVHLIEAGNGEIYMSLTKWRSTEIVILLLGVSKMMETNGIPFLPWKPVPNLMLTGSESPIVSFPVSSSSPTSEQECSCIKTGKVIRYRYMDDHSAATFNRYSVTPIEEKFECCVPMVFMPREPYLCAIWIDPIFD
ncbi:hypothetical protein AMTR_s00057p00190290 [Amborella trichopoda]|uniref:Uncharacterized protein n=1 Tax=Amborella trichopoda TaxID=13333 RepID=U5D3E4_AMBTC|nr:hypothetical protein AMTR_s00057p00190290 [Amborella trichopoda]